MTLFEFMEVLYGSWN